MKNMPCFECCSYRNFDQNEKHVTRICDQNVLIFMFSGILRFIEDGNSIELHSGEYYIQKKGLFQEGRFSSEIPQYFFIHFWGEYENIPVRGNFKKSDFDNFFNILNSPSSSEYKKQSIFFEILEKLSDLTHNNRDCIELKIKSYIDTHYLQNIDTQILSREFSYSKQHIEKIFKEKYGTTIHKYITQKRIDEAKFLILTTSRNLENIAYNCGYKEFSTFYRNFISLEGVSPLKWKKDSITV